MSTTLRDPREIIREEMVMQRPILRLLEEGPLTVPEIADKLGHPTDEVVFWVMGMRRYGHVVEVDDADDDGYFRYANAHQEVAS
ncbi:MAG: MarR family transcriptional regulator [Phycicoccus sp.]|nr:MarR family transcriptional regulator [Phycicoccus sp.]